MAPGSFVPTELATGVNAEHDHEPSRGTRDSHFHDEVGDASHHGAPAVAGLPPARPRPGAAGDAAGLRRRHALAHAETVYDDDRLTRLKSDDQSAFEEAT